MDVPDIAARDDVLQQPTRSRLFALLAELRSPASTEELAARVGLHRSGVRVHLGRLEAAGLVERRRAPQARGRPRDAWSISARARPGGERPHAYAELAGWLASAIPSRADRLHEVEAAGRRLGRELAGDELDLPLDQRVEAILAALGFQPSRHEEDAGAVRFALGNCPYRTAVRANQPVVCTLHRGLTQGLLERLEPAAALRSFVPRDPDEAGCLIEIDAGPPGTSSRATRPRAAGRGRA
jgi:predicted ArsR family transcriptional regulator